MAISMTAIGAVKPLRLLLIVGAAIGCTGSADQDLLAAVARDIGREERELKRLESNTDPRLAPGTPWELEVPEVLFDVSGRWVDDRKSLVKTLDADRDGRPEVELTFDARGDQLIERAEDSNYDGRLDVTNFYAEFQIVRRTEDRNHDGRPDRWLYYDSERVARMEVDRDYDGAKDAFYAYVGPRLVEVEHDLDGDGRPEFRTHFDKGRRTLEEEDSDGDGALDRWIAYDEKEHPARIGTDTSGDGEVDRWEPYTAPVEAAQHDCVEQKQCREYLASIQAEVVARWVTPRSVTTAQVVKLGFEVDRAGDLSRVEVVEAKNELVARSGLIAFLTSRPFAPPPEEYRHLTSRRIIATFAIGED